MKKKNKTQIKPGALCTLPSGFMLLAFTIAPLVLLILFSFMNRNLFAGQAWPGWTLGNVTRLMGHATFWKLMLKSIGIGLLVTAICIVLAYPVAWAIAKVVKPKSRSIFMMIVILPFFTSQLLLIYAMMNLIQSGGLIMTALASLGIETKSILYTNAATVLILVYEFLPYMILCLYSSMEAVNDNIIQASHVLGAGWFRTFINVVFPMSIPGLMSGILLVFVPVVGTFVEPALVGGSNGMMVGNVINTQYQENLNMGYGAILSCALLIILCVIMAIISFATKRAQKHIGGEA
ncbi:MAG: ABC transporter permease [Parasporobacterium sp.]|nr:ABC transporter permease [Parasporobacterium sp.]